MLFQKYESVKFITYKKTIVGQLIRNQCFQEQSDLYLWLETNFASEIEPEMRVVGQLSIVISVLFTFIHAVFSDILLFYHTVRWSKTHSWDFIILHEYLTYIHQRLDAAPY